MNHCTPSTITVALALCLALAVTALPAVADPREDRLFDAIVDILDTQVKEGESKAIEQIKRCYTTHTLPGGGLTPELEACIAQDIAYTYYSNFYHPRPHGTLPPEYVYFDASEGRIDEALDTCGLAKERQIEEMRIVGSIAFKSTKPALDLVK